MTNNTEIVEFEDSVQKLKKEARVVTSNPNCDATLNVQMEKNELCEEFRKAKDHSSAKLYASFSNLINFTAWVAVALAIILAIWWCVLHAQIAYYEYSEVELIRLKELISKFESIFSYIVTTALGFAGGVCKVFFNFNRN